MAKMASVLFVSLVVVFTSIGCSKKDSGDVGKNDSSKSSTPATPTAPADTASREKQAEAKPTTTRPEDKPDVQQQLQQHLGHFRDAMEVKDFVTAKIQLDAARALAPNDPQVQKAALDLRRESAAPRPPRRSRP